MRSLICGGVSSGVGHLMWIEVELIRIKFSSPHNRQCRSFKMQMHFLSFCVFFGSAKRSERSRKELKALTVYCNIYKWNSIRFELRRWIRWRRAFITTFMEAICMKSLYMQLTAIFSSTTLKWVRVNRKTKTR